MLLELRARAEATTSELATELEISPPTVRAAVQALSRRGLVETVDVETGRPGRPTPRFRFRTTSVAFVGVDIDDTETTIRVAGLDGRQVGESLVPSGGRPWDVDTGVRLIGEAVQVLLPSASIGAMAIAVPAWVERDGRIRESPAMPELGGVHLRETLQDIFRCPVLVENDVQLAGLAEHRFGAARQTRTYVYLWAGARVNASVFIEGHLHRGTTGIAGAIGNRDMEWGAAPLLRPTPQQFAAAAAEDDDGPARRAVLRYVNALSSGLSALTLALDPELITIGGHRPEEAALLAECLGPAVRRDTFVASPSVVPAMVGADARVLGALSLATDVGERNILGIGRMARTG